jgi:hypothetical protein
MLKIELGRESTFGIEGIEVAPCSRSGSGMQTLRLD